MERRGPGKPSLSTVTELSPEIKQKATESSRGSTCQAARRAGGEREAGKSSGTVGAERERRRGPGKSGRERAGQVVYD